MHEREAERVRELHHRDRLELSTEAPPPAVACKACGEVTQVNGTVENWNPQAAHIDSRASCSQRKPDAAQRHLQELRSFDVERSLARCLALPGYTTAQPEHGKTSLPILRGNVIQL